MDHPTPRRTLLKAGIAAMAAPVAAAAQPVASAAQSWYRNAERVIDRSSPFLST
ncbi:MAG TPA: hypothetical protein VKX28_24605 [Xanthobacteraceae bacterium]|nr:hypothetical protein [Xanthobacteraceae bacterium]